MPTDLSIGRGRPAEFTAVASGINTNESNFMYQWRKRDSNGLSNTVPGANGAVLIIPSVSESDTGQYYCIITNEWGRSVESDNVSLAVFGTYIIDSYIVIYTMVMRVNCCLVAFNFVLSQLFYFVCTLNIAYHNCDWILENRPNCHTGPIPFYWPS